MQAVTLMHGDAMRRCDDLRLKAKEPKGRTDKISDEALERGRKKRAIEIIEEARGLGGEIIEVWEDE